MGVEEDLRQLIDFMKKMVCLFWQSPSLCHFYRLDLLCVLLQGKSNHSGQFVVKYGDFVTDPLVTNTFEAPFGVLKSARKRKIVAFDGEILLSPMHDQVDITLIKDTF